MLAGVAAGQTPDFVTHLLEVPTLLAPAYTLQACQAAGDEVRAFLEKSADSQRERETAVGSYENGYFQDRKI